ncbi:MAG: universal stress protein [Deltaproteobacteria bacterium]|jgi:hypothetical protein|nr:universal stress protein [Deltaproteobacteria bacterium]
MSDETPNHDPREFDIRVDRVVCAVADAELGRIPLEHAIMRALREGDTEIHVVRVIAEGSDDDAVDAERKWLMDLAHQEVEQLSSKDDNAVPAIFAHVMVGSVADELVGLCRNLSADHLILGPGRNPGASLVASVLADPPCSIEVVQPKSHDPEHEEERRKSCPKCAAVRSKTQAQQWLCEDHAGSEWHRFPIISSGSLRPTSFG